MPGMPATTVVRSNEKPSLVKTRRRDVLRVHPSDETLQTELMARIIDGRACRLSRQTLPPKTRQEAVPEVDVSRVRQKFGPANTYDLPRLLPNAGEGEPEFVPPLLGAATTRAFGIGRMPGAA